MNQIHKNLLSNIASLLANVIIGLYYTPYLVNNLGLAAYGILPLTLIVNHYISVLSSSLTGALSRFYTISVQKEDYLYASRIFSTILIVIVLLTILLFPVIWLFISNLEKVFNLPNDLLVISKLLFVFTLSGFFLSLFSSILNIILYAQNRLDLMNIIKISRIGLRFILVLIFFETLQINLIYVGIANCVTELFVLIISLCCFFKYSPKKIRVGFSLFDKSVLSGILGMTLWTIIHQMGDVFLYRIDNLVVNRFWGTIYSGALGAVSEFGIYISLIVSVISSLFGPMILIAYSKNRHEEVKKLAINNSLIVGILTSIFVGCLIAYSDLVINVWLGEDYIIYSDWFVLKLVSLPLCAAAGVFAYVNKACNLVKYPALFTVLLGLVNISLLLVIAKFISFIQPIKTVSLMLIVSSLIIIIQSYGLNSYYFNKVYTVNISNFMRNVIKILISIVLSYSIAKFSLQIFTPTSLFEILVSLTIIGLLNLFIAYLLLFNSEERKSLLSIIFKSE